MQQGMTSRFDRVSLIESDMTKARRSSAVAGGQ